MKKGLVICYLFSITIFAQQETNHSFNKTENLKSWFQYCSEILKDEKYQKLIIEADKGIINAKKEPKYLSKFYFLKGYGYEYSNNQYQNAQNCYEKSLLYAQKFKQIEDETSALMRLSYSYYSTNNFTKRDQLIAYIKKVVDTTKNIKSKSILNGSIAEYYLDNTNYEQFIKYQLIAIDYKKRLPNETVIAENIGISYSQIASAYIKMKQYNRAIEYLNDAMPCLKESNYGKSFCCNYYIEAYSNLKNNDSIQKYYKLLYVYATKGEILYLNLSFGNINLAEYYAKTDQTDKAYSTALKAVTLAKKSNDEEILMEANTVLGSIEYKKGNYKKAIDVLRLASKNALNLDKPFFVKINKKLSESYAALGDWENAYHYNEIHSKYNNEILQESAKQSIANAEAQYQNKTKKQEIKYLTTQNTLKNIQIEDVKKERLFLFLGILLVGIIGILLFKQNQNRKKANQKLQLLNQELDQANKIKARFFSILNHDLRSPVSNLIHFLHLQKDSPELLNEETKIRMQNKTIAGAEDLLIAMEDILLWSKGQMENFKPNPVSVSIQQLFDDTKRIFSSYENIQFEYNNPENIQLITDENYLKTIVRNLSANAIKAIENSENPKIIWEAKQTNGKILVSITDNGPGANLEKFKALYDDREVVGIKTGLGLHLIRDLAKAIHCQITIDSKGNQGTTFNLEL